MKHFIIFLMLLFTAFGFAQNTGLIVGKVLDKEFNNNPLVLANVSVKGTLLESTTNQTGLFVIENIKDGDYTLVCSFVGYETKEIKVNVVSGKTENIKVSLGASTISLEDLALISNATSQKGDKKVTATLN